MRILALETTVPGVHKEQFSPALMREEARQAWALQQSGIFREIYFRGDVRLAVLLLESPSVEDARAALATLPLVAAGLIGFDVIPLMPYPGFARLFAADDLPHRDTPDHA
jgi:muconolactone delta-isomerase